MTRIILTTILTAFFLFSCKVHKSRKIVRAYVNCVSGDSVQINIDSLKYFLDEARGKLKPGYLAKGASKIKMEYKNGSHKTIQIIWGRQTIFHFSRGCKKNVWYTFNDTIVDKQWHTFFKNISNKCKNN